MKLMFWGLFAAGFTACSMFGIGRTLERAGGSWASPWMIGGSVLGAGILVLAAAFAMGFRPAAITDRAYVLALLGLIVAKVAVSFAQAFVVAGRG